MAEQLPTKFNRGDPIRAEDFNAILSVLRKNLSAAAPLQIIHGAEGIIIALGRPFPTATKPELAILTEQLSQDGTAEATLRTWSGSDYDDGDTIEVNDYLLDDDADPLPAGTRVIIAPFPDGRYYVISAACSVRSGEEPA